MLVSNSSAVQLLVSAGCQIFSIMVSCRPEMLPIIDGHMLNLVGETESARSVYLGVLVL
jgi:hypothetical protein